MYGNKANSQKKPTLKIEKFNSILLTLDPPHPQYGIVHLEGSSLVPDSLRREERKKQSGTFLKHPGQSVYYPRDCFLS